MLLTIRNLGIRSYVEVWQAMRQFTDSRDKTSPDQLWVLQHYPVYTQGLKGRSENILDPESIPVIQTDRGGQSTYHGPGQLIIYTLIDLNRKRIGARVLVSSLERAIIEMLEQYGVSAFSIPKAPGVYVAGKKIASIGLRIRKGCSYHGLSCNVSMDLSPFKGIHPCGYPGLEVTQVADLNGPQNPLEVSVPVIQHLLKELDYDGIEQTDFDHPQGDGPKIG